MASRLRRSTVALVTLAAIGLPLAAGAQEMPPILGPQSDDDTGGHETPNPSGSDHASATAWAITNAEGEEFITIGQTHSEMDEDGANRSEATGLSVMGVPVAAASSQARNGSGESHSESSTACIVEGFLCPGLVFADTWNRDGANSSTAESSAGLASMCVIDGGGGIVVRANGEACALEIQVIASYSRVHQNKQTGEGNAQSQSIPLIICAYDEPVTNGISVTEHGEPLFCAGAFSFSFSETDGTSEGDTARFSFFFYDPEGDENDEFFSENQTFWGDLEGGEAGDDGCPSDEITFGYCAHFNQGESFEFPGGAGSRQEAMHAVGYSEGTSFGEFHFGVTETLVRATDVVLGGVQRPGSTLALTGAGLTELLGLALALLLASGLSLVASRRSA